MLLDQRARERLVATLREKGIADQRVLTAFGAVPRHRFVDQALRRRAYDDLALPIGLGQTISQPFTVATMTALLRVEPGDRVLEVGTGSGYQAAILVEMGARVYSIERHRRLLDRTRALLDELKYTVRTRHGDGTKGWSAHAPYDGIVVTAGGDVPDALLQQLRLPDPEDDKKGGRLVIPVGETGHQVLHRITCKGKEEFHDERFMSCTFVPLIRD